MFFILTLQVIKGFQISFSVKTPAKINFFKAQARYFDISGYLTNKYLNNVWGTTPRNSPMNPTKISFLNGLS